MNLFEKVILKITSYLKKNEKNKYIDEEYIMIKEKSLESEKKLLDTIKKIENIKILLKEVSLLQMDLSYSLNEMAVGDLQIVQQLNSFTDVIRELITQQEQFEICLSERLLFPLSSFSNQFKSLQTREKELEKRKHSMEKTMKQICW